MKTLCDVTLEVVTLHMMDELEGNKSENSKVHLAVYCGSPREELWLGPGFSSGWKKGDEILFKI